MSTARVDDIKGNQPKLFPDKSRRVASPPRLVPLLLLLNGHSCTAAGIHRKEQLAVDQILFVKVKPEWRITGSAAE